MLSNIVVFFRIYFGFISKSSPYGLPLPPKVTAAALAYVVVPLNCLYLGIGKTLSSFARNGVQRRVSGSIAYNRCRTLNPTRLPWFQSLVMDYLVNLFFNPIFKAKLLSVLCRVSNCGANKLRCGLKFTLQLIHSSAFKHMSTGFEFFK